MSMSLLSSWWANPWELMVVRRWDLVGGSGSWGCNFEDYSWFLTPSWQAVSLFPARTLPCTSALAFLPCCWLTMDCNLWNGESIELSYSGYVITYFILTTESCQYSSPHLDATPLHDLSNARFAFWPSFDHWNLSKLYCKKNVFSILVISFFL